MDNLLIRGYLAAGLASLSEGKRVLNTILPKLILLCQAAELSDDDAKALRTNPRLASIPVVLVSAKSADPQWLAKRNISLELSYPIDPSRLVEELKPWLPNIEPGRDKLALGDRPSA
ncbi:MAG: hypothetical protein JXB07_02055 [Anaerolineae bacterium]|nr:hypothetical protein [Anaerolineae bacterium]